MNRRDLLKRVFAYSASGLLLPQMEPVRRYWSLDQTMLASGNYDTGWFDSSMPPFTKTFAEGTIEITEKDSMFNVYDMIYVNREPMWIQSIEHSPVSTHATLHVYRMTA